MNSDIYITATVPGTKKYQSLYIVKVEVITGKSIQKDVMRNRLAIE